MIQLDVDWAVAWMRATVKTISLNRTELGDLDRAIGDGDHGENMNRGFSAVAAELDSASDAATPAQVLRMVGMTLISTVGGAAGPLYGTAFLRAADALGSAAQLDSAGVAALLRAGCDGIVQRGKASAGDKTMVDAWDAAAEAAEHAQSSGETTEASLVAAAEAAEAAAEATEPLMARKGRASYLGERARGHRDPGAQSSALIIRAAAVAARAER